MRTLQTTKAGNKRMKLLRLLVGRAIDHTHEEKKKSRSRFPVAQPFFSHAKKSLLALLIFLICIRIYDIAASFQFSSPRAHSSIINHVSSKSCISTTNNSFISSDERLSLETSFMNLWMTTNLLNQLSWRNVLRVLISTGATPQFLSKLTPLSTLYANFKNS